MAVTNHERVGKGLEHLVKGLKPFVERELRSSFGDRWQQTTAEKIVEDKVRTDLMKKPPHWDAQALLTVMMNTWNDAFKTHLGHAERALVGELRDIRNKWAHQHTFNTDDAYRALDTVHRLLTAVSASEDAAEVHKHKQELLRVRFDEEAKREVRKVAVAPVAGQPQGGLKPWREIVTPHPDVASGRYQQAEFAADLGQVHRFDLGIAKKEDVAVEYRDAKEFFRRTYMTEGLKQLLGRGLARVTGKGGDPVIELQTNFGGGKTHALLALYHMLGGTSLSDLAGMEEPIRIAGTADVPKVRRAVLVGRDQSPGQPRKKPDGVVVNTLWGELAYQLGGKEGYDIVAEADKTATSPGDALVELFRKFSPCLILVDEWVVYARQLYRVEGLPGGTLETQFSFAQTLTEAAKSAPRTLLVVSIPASDIEIGGDGGQVALDGIKKVVGRVQTPWSPASADESFEIVRRRLFSPITEKENFRGRDAVVKGFMDLYRTQAGEFPATCREAEYERRLQAAYPIHPELFDRLYTDWSTLEKFQRTRGVLRLMAAVIHSLWERQDSSLLIMPGAVPIDDGSVQYELKTYLEDNWGPVIESDVDGPNSLPLRLDRENPNLGRYSASRRVARALYLGSAPTLRTSHRGLEDRSLKLACVQPGESPAVFGDALRRLTDQATHLYVDGQRYWFSTQPSVTRLAQDRAAQYERREDEVDEDIIARIKDNASRRDDFAAVHVAPDSTGVIPDEREARLVILGPRHAHTSKTDDSTARAFTGELLDKRGNDQRHYRNALVFLAPDKARLADLRQAVRQYLAWKSIEDEKVSLNLDAFQSKQAEAKRTSAEEAVRARIPEAFCWLLVPVQPDPKADKIEWQEVRLQGQDPLPVRAARKLKNEELLVVQLAGTRLKHELDRIPLWRGDSVKIKELAENFAKYLYLPRLKNTEVLTDAIRDGLGLLTWPSETFGYAEGFDAAKSRYKGLQAGRAVRVVLNADTVLVKPDVAEKQLDEDQKPTSGPGPHPSPEGDGGDQMPPGPRPPGPQPVAGSARPTRFYGTVTLNPEKMREEAGKVADAIVQHLASLMGSKVDVTLEIHAEVPDGVPEHAERTVLENASTLKFKNKGFER